MVVRAIQNRARLGLRPLAITLDHSWKLASLAPSPPPLEVSKAGSPDCWRANYTGHGTAQFWLCRYRDKTGAFDAAQDARTEPQIMKFQEGDYLVVVEWNDDSIADLTTIVRAVQKNLGGK